MSASPGSCWGPQTSAAPVVRRVPSAASRRLPHPTTSPPAADASRCGDCGATESDARQPVITEAAVAADQLRSRINALRGAVTAMREIHGALMSRLHAVRDDEASTAAIRESLRLRQELLQDEADDEEDDDDGDRPATEDDADRAAPPASRVAIDSLERIVRVPESEHHAPQHLRGAPLHICVICQEPPRDYVWVRLPSCRHEFCEACAVQWLALSRTCPTCRTHVVTPRPSPEKHTSSAAGHASTSCDATSSQRPLVRAVLLRSEPNCLERATRRCDEPLRDVEQRDSRTTAAPLQRPPTAGQSQVAQRLNLLAARAGSAAPQRSSSATPSAARPTVAQQMNSFTVDALTTSLPAPRVLMLHRPFSARRRPVGSSLSPPSEQPLLPAEVGAPSSTGFPAPRFRPPSAVVKADPQPAAAAANAVSLAARGGTATTTVALRALIGRGAPVAAAMPRPQSAMLASVARTVAMGGDHPAPLCGNQVRLGLRPSSAFASRLRSATTSAASASPSGRW